MARENKMKRQGSQKEPLLPFKKMNYILFGIGIIIIILGYIALAQGPYNSRISLNIAPVLLILGYVGIIPIAILYKKKE